MIGMLGTIATMIACSLAVLRNSHFYVALAMAFAFATMVILVVEDYRQREGGKR